MSDTAVTQTKHVRTLLILYTQFHDSLQGTMPLAADAHDPPYTQQALKPPVNVSLPTDAPSNPAVSLMTLVAAPAAMIRKMLMMAISMMSGPAVTTAAPGDTITDGPPYTTGGLGMMMGALQIRSMQRFSTNVKSRCFALLMPSHAVHDNPDTTKETHRHNRPCWSALSCVHRSQQPQPREADMGPLPACCCSGWLHTPMVVTHLYVLSGALYELMPPEYPPE